MHRDTSSFPPVRPDEDRRTKVGTWIVGTIAGLLALALLGWGLNTYLDNQQREANMVLVPSVEGQPRATAQLKISQAGLVPEVTSEKSAEVEADHVIRQSPQGAVRVSKGSTVELVISSGPEAVPVPNLVGKTEAEARAILEGIKLTLGAVEEVNDTKAAKGKITESVPAAGDEVAPGTEVKVKVSSGKVTVPDLVGKTQNEAFTLLTEAGLTPKSAYKQTADAAEGTVLEQDKKAGDVVDAASVVLITIAQASPPTPTPSASATPTPSASVTPTPASPSPSVSPS
jgi:serine/threonine-protein kinase